MLDQSILISRTNVGIFDWMGFVVTRNTFVKKTSMLRLKALWHKGPAMFIAFQCHDVIMSELTGDQSDHIVCGSFAGCRHTENNTLHPGLLFSKRTGALPQDLMKSQRREIQLFDFSNRFASWQTPQQQHCRGAWQMVERYDHYNIQSRGHGVLTWSIHHTLQG